MGHMSSCGLWKRVGRGALFYIFANSLMSGLTEAGFSHLLLHSDGYKMSFRLQDRKKIPLTQMLGKGGPYSPHFENHCPSVASGLSDETLTAGSQALPHHLKSCPS